MNSLANKFKSKAASQLYSNRVQNMTQKELIIRSYFKSAQFIEIAIDNHNEHNLTEYRDNLHKSIAILQNMLENLNFYDKSGETLEVASNLFASYNFILKVLRDGMKDNSIKDFNICVKYLNELKSAFEQIK